MRRARRSIEVTGIVQGVGFRPRVHALATLLGLGGTVQNRSGDVEIEIEGDDEGVLDRFVRELVGTPPPASRIDALRTRAIAARGEHAFRILESPSGRGGLFAIAPDLATCADCLRELRDPEDRRYGHPFVTCTACGPKLTLATGVPYDRARTTMAPFAMCARCRAEYELVGGRRHHAQPIACPECGPRLRAVRGGTEVHGDPIALAADAIAAGEIAAIKGIGGFHLACLARDEGVVEELRRRKQRDAKPFAIMVRDLVEAQSVVVLGERERELLASSAAPIVLARRSGGGIAPAVAPDGDLLGVMLPYTPVHVLLFDALAVRGAHTSPIVMTSGNLSDEPIACDDADALARLGAIADLFVLSDRAIFTRCDDSVARVIDGAPTLLRRSRGYAPAPIALSTPLAQPTLAVGAHMKSVFAIGEGTRALVGPHVGDLEHDAAARALRSTIAHFEALLGQRPARIVHDLHPDYGSSVYAEERARAGDAELIAVQHHHAHFASCLADAGHTGPAIGICFDGSGLGEDGAIWGGEILVGTAAAVERAAHLAYVRMPGGDRAAREGWRMAIAHAMAAGLAPDELPLSRRIDRGALRAIASMVESGIQAPWTSSAGRLFDAVASLIGVRDRSAYDGHCAMMLEALARTSDDPEQYPFAIRDAHIQLEETFRTIVRDVAQGRGSAAIARRFHRTLASAAVAACVVIASRRGIQHVALSGGVFQNALFAADVGAGLYAAGLSPLRHRTVPPNDGGICLGQLAVVAAHDGAA